MSAPISLLWFAVSSELGMVILAVLAIAIVTAVIVFGGGWS
jgi:hypothetical protein